MPHVAGSTGNLWSSPRLHGIVACVACFASLGADAFTTSPPLRASVWSGPRTWQHSRAVTPRMMGEFIDDEKSAKLRAMLNKQFGKGDDTRPEEWCKPTDTLSPGTVLIADPAPFLQGDPGTLEKFSLSQAIPGTDVIPADRAADLLPVVLLIDHGPMGTTGVMLNRRTGALMGDLGEAMSSFMIQPIWQGGNQGAQQMSYIHTYGQVTGAQALGDEGLFFGGDFDSACEVVGEQGPGSGFNFRFFVQLTQWGPGELEKETSQGLWHTARASKMSLLRARDRRGPDACKTMWADLLDLAGGEHKAVMEAFYNR